ncbi:hypothetical protein [Roseibium marinum]|uniref:Uncharacterized protein n=1 Tax=Roseibium marinum TaxID=281252 RepID=A0A2S3UX34_9HYPH|nr:hypothetical protein [Roseibium marinum]POF32234.1 hypothetical protein CLV41_103155 [Roseibium marinum]
MTEKNKGTLSSASITASGQWTWSVTLTDFGGNCLISWSSNAPFRAQESKVQLFEFPSGDVVAETWATEQSGSWDTGKPYGQGWGARYIAQIGPTGSKHTYQTVLQTQPSH